VAPDGETVAGCRIGKLACGTHGIEHGARFAHPDEVGMHPLPAEAHVVGSGDDEAAIEHVLDAGNGTRQIRQQRRCTFLDDTRGRVRPSDDVALSTRRGFFPEQHRAGHRDGLSVEPRRSVEDAIGRGVLDRATYLRPHAQDGARLRGGDLMAADVAERSPAPGCTGIARR
jgi:hypothetical protein